MQRAQNFVESMKTRNLGQNPIPPTDFQMFQRLTDSGIQLTKEEFILENESMTPEHYDEQIISAIEKLLFSKEVPINPTDLKKVEQPSVFIHRIGRESIAAGKASPFYMEILAEMERGLTFPQINSRSMATKQKWLDIAIAYRKSLSEILDNATKSAANSGGKIKVNFLEAKNAFKVKCEVDGYISKDTVDDALRHHNLGLSAYSVMPRRKNKKKIP